MIASAPEATPVTGDQRSARTDDARPINYRIEPFDEECCIRLCEQLADLHIALLSHSPVARLGRDFMAGFYYRELPRMGLIFGQVAYINERPAGFIVATHQASGFMGQAIRRRFLPLAWLMVWTIIRSPRRISAIWEALKIMRGLPSDDSARASGELLSLGVLAEFRSREFIRSARLRISQDLLDAAMAQLQSRGVKSVRVMVDADNPEARLFYLGNGWRPGRSSVPGWHKETVELVWPP